MLGAIFRPALCAVFDRRHGNEIDAQPRDVKDAYHIWQERARDWLAPLRRLSRHLDLNRWFRSAIPLPWDFYVWADDRETIPLAGCGTANLADLGWSFRSLGLGAIFTAERQRPDFLRSLASKNFLILVASLEPNATRSLVQKFADVGVAVKTEPVKIHEGNLLLNFEAIRPATARS